MLSNCTFFQNNVQGKVKLFGFFVGKVMVASGGKADPIASNNILMDKLAEEA
jgi:Asp-tRNA(Asn)/Glu-tRNA(Gln) amidotransferase B subunit